MERILYLDDDAWLFPGGMLGAWPKNPQFPLKLYYKTVNAPPDYLSIPITH